MRMMNKNFKKNQQKDKFFVRRNEGIRIPQVLLVEDGVKLGVFKTADALRMARDKGLDLVEVAPHAKPHPVCSIMDYGKYRFEMQQKKKKQEKNSGPKEKEISFRYVIDDNDLQTKVNQIKGYLEKGDRVKITVKFKGRENAHKDQGMVVIKQCLEALAEVADIEKQPSFEGGQITARVTKKGK